MSRIPDSDAGYLEILTKSIFQAGFSWEVIRQKWPHFHHLGPTGCFVFLYTVAEDVPAWEQRNA